ncbi:MFS transporter [Longirhabdus pacifica]|uniref:MFS transporter n=1 Tax=Longirhabdus pacifica TaxID=2305227 RepID=UPI0013E8E916|nr:MFS transporter [Longirhabdus pacifica]
MNNKLIRVLKIKEFKWLYSGQVLSDFGNWLSFIAISVMFTYYWELPPEKLALFPIFIALPWIILSPISGVWADRLPKKQLMIGCDIIRSIFMFMLVFTQNYWMVIFLAVLVHSVTTLFDPARQAAIKQYVPEDQRMQANALSQLSVQLSKVLAPTLGGLVVSLGSPSLAFTANSICFLISALCLTMLPKTEDTLSISKSISKEKMDKSEPTEKKGKTFLSEMASGWKVIAQSKYLMLAITCVFASMFFVFLYDSFIALWSKEIGIPPTMFSLIISGIGIGSIVGAFIVGSFAERIHPLRLMLCIPILNGLLFAVIGLGGMTVLGMHVIGWFMVWMLVGVIGAGVPIAFATIIQQQSPDGMTGKVYAFSQSIVHIPIIVAPLLGAQVINILGIGSVFLIAGGVFCFVSTIGLLWFEWSERKGKGQPSSKQGTEMVSAND